MVNRENYKLYGFTSPSLKRGKYRNSAWHPKGGHGWKFKIGRFYTRRPRGMKVKI